MTMTVEVEWCPGTCGFVTMRRTSGQPPLWHPPLIMLCPSSSSSSSYIITTVGPEAWSTNISSMIHITWEARCPHAHPSSLRTSTRAWASPCVVVEGTVGLLEQVQHLILTCRCRHPLAWCGDVVPLRDGVAYSDLALDDGLDGAAIISEQAIIWAPRGESEVHDGLFEVVHMYDALHHIAHASTVTAPVHE